jgi:hypothetical protein
MAENKYHLQDLDASFYVWDKLWSFHDHLTAGSSSSSISSATFRRFNILDTLIFNNNDIVCWLFTTKEGEVKSRSKKNRSLDKITQLLFLSEQSNNVFHDCLSGSSSFVSSLLDVKSQDNNSSNNGNQLFSYRSGVNEVVHSEGFFLRIDNSSGFEELLHQQSRTKVILSRPSKIQQNGKYLRIICHKSGKITIKNIKCFLLVESSLSGYASKASSSLISLASSSQDENSDKRKRIKMPYQEVSCRNNVIIELAKEFSLQLMKLLEGKELNLIEKLSMVVILEDLTKESHLQSSTSPTAPYSFWLHSVEDLILTSSVQSSPFPFDANSDLNSDVFSLSTTSNMNNPQLSRIQKSFSLSSIGSQITSLSSMKSLNKVPSLCQGDFCFYLSKSSSSFHSPSKKPATASHIDSVLEMIFDEVDIKTESHKAIKRHKRDDDEEEGSNSPSNSPIPFIVKSPSSLALFTSSSSSVSQKQKSGSFHEIEEAVDSREVDGEGSIGQNDELEDDQGMSTAGSISSSSILPLHQMKPKKLCRLLYKSISLSREEMNSLENIEKRFLNLFLPVNFDEILEIRKAINEIWPMPIAKYWFNEGKYHLLSLKRRRQSSLTAHMGMVPSILHHKLLRPTSSDGSPEKKVDFSPKHGRLKKHGIAGADNGDNTTMISMKEENKWFSHHFSEVEVCESCYFVYLELEKYRSGRDVKYRRNQALLKDNHLTEEERKLKDREIEKRIFQQRKAMSKLSKSSSAPAGSSSSQLLPPTGKRRGMGGPSSYNNRLLPPLPWNLANSNDQKAYFDENIPTLKHIMRKNPVPIPFKGDSDEITENTFDEMRRNYDNHQINEFSFQPTIVSKELPKNEKKVNVKDYTPEHLYHKWQRDISRLRSLIHKDGKKEVKMLVTYMISKVRYRFPLQSKKLVIRLMMKTMMMKMVQMN